MSSISAGTTLGTALVSTGDTTGELVLKTNGNTVALTINTTQALGVGTSPSYGTTGQVLTSSGSSSAPTWQDAASGAQGFVTMATGANVSPGSSNDSFALI